MLMDFRAGIVCEDVYRNKSSVTDKQGATEATSQSSYLFNHVSFFDILSLSLVHALPLPWGV